MRNPQGKRLVLRDLMRTRQALREGRFISNQTEELDAKLTARIEALEGQGVTPAGGDSANPMGISSREDKAA